MVAVLIAISRRALLAILCAVFIMVGHSYRTLLLLPEAYHRRGSIKRNGCTSNISSLVDDERHLLYIVEEGKPAAWLQPDA
jgi:hypothetical protein